MLDGLAVALNKKPTAADDKDAAPSARGETGAESFNDAYVDIPDAERSTAQVFEAFLGQEPGEDLSRLIDGTARTAGALIRHEEQLKDLITNFNRTTAAFASESDNLQRVDPRAGADARERQRRVRLAQRRVPADARLRARDPAGRPRDPGHDRGVVPVDRADAQARLRAASSAGSSRSSRRPPRDLARLTDAAIDLLPQTTLTSRCARQVLLPAGDLVIKDEFETGAENYKEFFWALVAPRGRGPELRRQRHVRALPARRRLAGRLDGHRGRRRGRGVRQQRRRPARQPAVLSRQAPAVPARRALPHQQAPEPQRAGRGQDRAHEPTAQPSSTP